MTDGSESGYGGPTPAVFPAGVELFCFLCLLSPSDEHDLIRRLTMFSLISRKESPRKSPRKERPCLRPRVEDLEGRALLSGGRLMLLAAQSSANGFGMNTPPQVEPAQALLLGATGRITFLRVNDVGGYGPPNDFLDAEVVLQLDTQPGKAFGFQLRNDSKLPAHQAMFDLVMDAFDNNRPVTINYFINPGKNAGVIIRVWEVR